MKRSRKNRPPPQSSDLRPRTIDRYTIGIGLVLFGVLGLGIMGYRSTARLSEQSEQSVQRSTQILGASLIRKTEQSLIATSRTFFQLVSLGDPHEFQEMWKRIVQKSPSIESVMVLDLRQKIHESTLAQEQESLMLPVVRHVSKLRYEQRKQFRIQVLPLVLRDMKIEELGEDKHRHIHKSYKETDYLLSYIRRKSASQDYIIMLKFDINYIKRTFFPAELEKINDNFIARVVDYSDTRIYQTAQQNYLNQPLFDSHFPTTLYKWRLQLSPRSLSLYDSTASKRKLAEILLFSSAVLVIWIASFMLWRVVRKERTLGALKSEFVTNVSHEIRTPLSLIRMFAELIASGGAAAKQNTEDYSKIILRESERLSSLVDNVLDFSRIERNELVYNMSRGDGGPVLERIIDLQKKRCEQSNVTLRYISPGRKVCFSFDESALSLLFLNLIENGIKYGTPDSSVSPKPRQVVTVTLAEHDDTVVFSVQDNGVGIPIEEQSIIFERFYRSKRAREGSQRGSGIGLNLVKHIADAHGAKIDLASAPGKGTRIRVAFPKETST